MAYATFNKPSLHFNTKLYTGTGSSNAVTGIGFQPDWVWIKRRSSSQDHNLYDVIRGSTKALESNSASVEQTKSDDLTSFDSDGFTLGSGVKTNANNETHVAWNWLAGGSASSNTDGNITSSVSANTAAGFSIVTYTTSSSGTDTVGHGLGVKPDVLITKSRDNAYNWDVLHQSINDNGSGRIILSSTNAFSGGSSPYANTTPTASVFSFNAGFYGASNNVTYCFAEKKGYSKFGSYTGNGNSNGTFIYTGFKPAWVLIKNYGAGGDSWQLQDIKRSGYNGANNVLAPNTNGAEGSNGLDILSNGFKIRTTASGWNSGNVGYIYMAFAAEPLVANVGESIPATAR